METTDGTAAAPETAEPTAASESAAPAAPTAAAPEAPAQQAQAQAPEAEPAAEKPAGDAPNIFEKLFDKEQPPAFVEALDVQLKNAGHESWKVTQEDFNKAIEGNPEFARLLHNARNLGLKRADAAARQQADLAKAQEAMKADRAKLDQERAKLWSMFENPDLKALAKPPEGEAPDYYTDPKGFAAWHAQKAASERIGQFMEGVGKASKDAEAKVQAALADQRRAVRKAELTSFTEQNPDFWDHADDIEKMQRAYKGMPAEKAYMLVKAEKGLLGQPAAQKEDPVAAARRAMRPGGNGVGTAIPETPKGLTGMELHDWYAKHPGAMERDAERVARRGRI
jgi:hypothetical protein